MSIKQCDFCKPVIISASTTPKTIYDGKTQYGSWAWMCQMHFEKYGVGLGTDKGQKFSQDAQGNLIKLRG